MGPLRALKNSEADGAAAGEAVVAEQVVPYVYAQSMLEKRLTVGGHGRTVDVRKFGTAAFSRGASAVILPAADAGGGEAPEAEMAQAAEGLDGGTSSAVFNTASFNADHASAERELESYTTRTRSYPAPASAEGTSRSRETSKGVAGDCTDEDRASYQARRGQVQALIDFLLAKKKAEEQAGGSPMNPPLPPRVGHHTTHSTQPALGCLRIDSLYRPAAGDVADPRSHEYPLVNRVVPGLTFEVVRSGKLDRAVRRNFVTAVKYLDKHPAVKVITGDCGFMMFFQELAQAYTRKPVALSSLMLITGLNQFIHPEKQICIVTANSGDLEPLIPVVSRVCGMGLQVFADADHGHDGVGSMTGSMLDLVSGTGGAGYSNAPGSSTTGGGALALAAAAAQQQPHLPSFAVGGPGMAPLQNYPFGPGIGMASAAPGGAPASAGAPMLSGTLGGGVGAPTSTSATAGTGPGRPAAGGQLAGSVSYLEEKNPSVGSSSSIARTDSSALSTASSQPKQEQSKIPAPADQMNRTPVAEAPATSNSKSHEYSKAFQFVSHDGKTMNLLAEKLQKLSLVDQDRGGEGEQNGDGKISKPQSKTHTTRRGQKVVLSQNNFLDGAFADELSSKLSALTQAFDAVEQDGKVPGERPPLEAPLLQPGGEQAAEESAVTTQQDQKPPRAAAGREVGAGAAAAELRPAAHHGEHLSGATAQDEKVDTDVERNGTSEGKIQGGRGKEEDAQGCARALTEVVTSSTTPGDHLTLSAATPAAAAFVDVTTVEHILDETTALAAQDVFGAQPHEMRTLKEMFHDEQEARKAHEDPHAPSPELKPIAAGGGAPTSALGLGAGGGFSLGGGSSRGGSPGTGAAPGAALGPTESVSSPRGTGSSVTSLNTSAGPSSIAPSANNSPLAGKAEPAAGGATGDAIFKLVPDAGAAPSGAPGQQNVKRQWQLPSTGAFHQSSQQQGGAGEQQTASGKTAGSSLTEASVAGTGSATIGTGTSSQRSNESSSFVASASGSIAPGTQIKLGTGDHPMAPTDSSSGHDFHIWHPRLQHLAGDTLQGPEQDISPCSPELKSIPKLSRTQKLTSIDPFAAGEQTVRSLSNLDDTDLDSSSFSLSRHGDVFARSRGYHDRSLQGVGAHSMSGSLSLRGRAGGDSLGEYTSRTRQDGRTALGALLLSKASRAQAGGTNSPRDQNLADGIHLNFGRQAQTASIKSNSLEMTTSGAPSSNSKNSSLDVVVAGTARTSSSDLRGSEGGLAARSDSNLSGGLPTTPSHANTNRSSSISGARAHRGSDDDRTSWTGRDGRGLALGQPDFSTMTDDASAASRNRMYPVVGLNNNAADNDPPARNRNAPGVLFSKLRVDSLSGGGEQLSPRAGPGAGAAASPNQNLQHLREAPADPAAARPAASDEVDDHDEEVDDDEEPPSLQRSSRYGETTSSSSSRLRHGVRTHSASPVPPQGDNMRPNPLSSLLVGGATPTFPNAAASTRKDYLEDIHVPVALPEGLTPALTRVAEHGQTILGPQQGGKDASRSMNNDEAPSSSSQGQVRRLSQTAAGPIEPGARISFSNMRRRSEEHHEHAKTTQHAAEATAGTLAQGRASVSDDQSYNLEPSSHSSSGAGMPFSAPPPPPSFLPDTTSSILGPIEQDFILHDVLTPGERAATAMLGPPTAAHDATQLEAITEDKELVLVTSSVTNNSFLLDHHLDVASAQNSQSLLNVSSSLDTSLAAAMAPAAVDENYPGGGGGATTAADHREISASFQQFLQKANETFQQQQKEKLRVAAAQAVDGGSCAVAEEGNIADLGPATPSPAPGAAALQQHHHQNQHHQNQHHVLFDLTEQEPTSSGSTVVPSNFASPVHESGTVVEPPPLGAPAGASASKRSKEDAGQHSSDDGSSGHRTPSRTGSSTAGKLMSPHQHHQADDQIGNQEIQAAPGSSDNGAGAASTPSLHPTHSATTTNATIVPPSDGSALLTYHSPVVGAVKSKSGSSSASLPQSQTVGAAEELRPSDVNYWGTLLGASNEMRKQVRKKQSVDEMALQPGLSLLCRSASTDEFLRQQQAAAFANEAYPTSQTPFSTAGGGTIASSLTNLNLASLAGIMKPPGGAPGGGAAGSSDNGHAAEHQVILAGGAHQHLARSNSKGSSHFNLAGGGTGTLHQQYGSSALLSRRDSRYLEVTVVEHHQTIGNQINACAPQHASYPAAGVHPTPAWLQQRLNAAMLQPSTETRHIDRQRFVVMGIEDLDHFDGIAEGYPLNFKDCEPLFLQKVNKLLELHPEIDCFLAECTQLPMFSDSVRALFGRPVYDIVCAAHMIMLGFLQSEHQVLEDGEKTQQNGYAYGYESGINGYGTAAGNIEGGINEAYIFGMELTLEERSQSAELQEFREMFAAAGIPLLEMKKVGGGGEKR